MDEIDTIASFASTTSRSGHAHLSGIQLFDLPTELILAILDYLDLPALVAFSITGKRARELVDLPTLRTRFVIITSQDVHDRLATSSDLEANRRARYLRITGYMNDLEQSFDWDPHEVNRIRELLRGFTNVEEFSTTIMSMSRTWMFVDRLSATLGMKNLQKLQITLGNEEGFGRSTIPTVFLRVHTLHLTMHVYVGNRHIPHILPHIHLRFPNLSHLLIRFTHSADPLLFLIFPPKDILFKHLKTLHILQPELQTRTYEIRDFGSHIRFLQNHPHLEILSLPNNYFFSLPNFRFQKDDITSDPPSRTQPVSQLKSLRSGMAFALIFLPYLYQSSPTLRLPRSDVDCESNHSSSSSYPPCTITDLHIEGRWETDLRVFESIIRLPSTIRPHLMMTSWSIFHSVKNLTLRHSSANRVSRQDFAKIPGYFHVLEEFHLDLFRLGASALEYCRLEWYAQDETFATKLPTLRIVSIQTSPNYDPDSIQIPIVTIDTFRIQREEGKATYEKESSLEREFEFEGVRWQRNYGTRWGVTEEDAR